MESWSAARYRLLGPALPPVSATLPVGELFKRSVLGALGQAYPGHTPEPFRPVHGPSSAASDHRHPFYLAEDADGDGGIDHFVVFVPKSVGVETLSVLDRAQPLAGEGTFSPCRLRRVWHGEPSSEAPGGLLRPAHVWRSATPYVPDLRLNKTFDVFAALFRELAWRDLPNASIELIAGPSGFVTERRAGERRHSLSGHGGAWVRLIFSEPVSGPLSLGFACHLGLGLFRRDQR